MTARPVLGWSAGGLSPRPALAAAGALIKTAPGWAGLAIILPLAALALLAPVLAPYGPIDLAGRSLLPPSSDHWMGTDNVGHDLFSGILFGARASLAIGFCAAAAAFLIGGTVGALAGYLRGWPEMVLMRVAELFQTLPVIIVVLFVVAMLGAHFWLLIAAVAFAIWPLEARIVHGQFVAITQRDYVAAARAAGLSTPHIILREILPNAMPPIIAQVALDAGLATLISAGLGFLGLSDPGVPSWGEMLNRGQSYLDTAWWMSIFPGAAICLTVLALNLLADGLTQVFDPRSAPAAARLQG
jgi:peptide/nickel transport system permease protein